MQSFALGTRTHLIVDAAGDKVKVVTGKAVRVTAVQYAYPEPGAPTPRPKHPLRVDGAESGPTGFRLSVEREGDRETCATCGPIWWWRLRLRSRWRFTWTRGTLTSRIVSARSRCPAARAA